MADTTLDVRDLSVAEQQLVEIARALSMRSRLIVMDEPTSSLTQRETERLFDALSEGGTDLFGLQDMPWGAYWGVILDRYGIRWMINYTPAS